MIGVWVSFCQKIFELIDPHWRTKNVTFAANGVAAKKCKNGC